MVDMKKKATDILEDYSNSYSQVDLKTLTKFLEQIKSEAIKEFAEKLTHTLVINNEENTEYFDFAYTLETIDNLVKEMTGKTKTADTDFPKDYSYGY